MGEDISLCCLHFGSVEMWRDFINLIDQHMNYGITQNIQTYFQFSIFSVLDLSLFAINEM